MNLRLQKFDGQIPTANICIPIKYVSRSCKTYVSIECQKGHCSQEISLIPGTKELRCRSSLPLHLHTCASPLLLPTATTDSASFSTSHPGWDHTQGGCKYNSHPSVAGGRYLAIMRLMVAALVAFVSLGVVATAQEVSIANLTACGVGNQGL